MTHPLWMPLCEDGSPDLGLFLYRNLTSHLPGPAGASTEAADATWAKMDDEVKSAIRSSVASLVGYLSSKHREEVARLEIALEQCQDDQ